MYVADIGQNLVEEVSPVTAGANLGWNRWEGSFAFVNRAGVDVSNPRGDPAMTYPVAEYAHGDPLLGSRAAATGVVVYREDEIPQLANRVLFGDFPSGEIFHFDADHPPQGGNQGFGRVLLDDGRGRAGHLPRGHPLEEPWSRPRRPALRHGARRARRPAEQARRGRAHARPGSLRGAGARRRVTLMHDAAGMGRMMADTSDADGTM